jgi:hypothetical protein
MEWPALESDPDIFNRYFHSLGLENFWEFQEVYDLSCEIPCSALVLAFRRVEGKEVFQGAPGEGLFFIKQVKKLDNACGLLAGLHSIFNVGAELVYGSVLEQLRDRICGLSPEEAAEVMVGDGGGDEWSACRERLHQSHQEFARMGQTSMTHKPKHHFIAVLPGVQVFDGGKSGPLKLADSGFCLEFFSILNRAIENNEIGEDINVMALQNLAFL